jgi:hypothetical protein
MPKTPQRKKKKMWNIYARITGVTKADYQKAYKKAGFRSQQQHIKSVVAEISNEVNK